MALITCPECKHQVSEHASSCPQCGYKLNILTTTLIKLNENKEIEPNQGASLGNPKMTLRSSIFTVLGILAVAFVGAGFFASLDKKEPPAPPPQPKSATEIRYERIKNGFDSWDGSHIQLTELIKKSMNDPKSFEFDSVNINLDAGEYLILTENFRGKNAFGGVMPGWVKAKVDQDGNVIKIIAEGP